MTPGRPESGVGRFARLRHGRVLGGALLAVLLALDFLPDVPGLGRPRFGWFDVCQWLAPRSRLSGLVVIVEIDDRSLARRGQWPWPRTDLADVVERIAGAGPAAIGLGFVMSERDRLSLQRLPELLPTIDAELAARLRAVPSNEAHLAAALRDRPVVLGVAGVAGGTGAGSSAPRRTAPARLVGSDPMPFLPRFETALRSVDEIDQAAEGHGLLNVGVDGGAVRRVPLVGRVGDLITPAFGLEMLRVGGGQLGFSVAAGPEGIAGVQVGDLVVPTGPDGSVWVRYARPTREWFVSAVDVIDGAVAPGAFEGKLVLVGVTALAVGDRMAIAGGATRSGVEIHAELIDSILTGALLARPGWAWGVERLFLLAGGLVVILTVPLWRGRASLVLILLLALAGGGSLALYHERFLLLDAATPSLRLVVLFGAMLGVALAKAERERAENERKRQFVTRAFQQFVSSEVVDRILQNPESLKFGGELRNLTVLFSDIRDFTTFTERNDPELIVQMLREYLTAMTRIVIEEGGTLDKYIGDAVMAEFGAPIAYPDHALRGCRAALRMTAEVQRLQAEWTAEGKEPFRIGFGVNTGNMVVGNLGSEQLFDYTVIGDEVNLGARLESLNKDYQTSTHIIISGAVCEAVGEAIQVKCLGEVKVKGKTRPVVIYELLGLIA